MKKLLYIGNNLRGGNPTTLLKLTELLKNESFRVISASSKNNKIHRLFDMCWLILKNNKADFVLIDTYSTQNFYYALIISQLSRLFKLKYIPITHGGNLQVRIKRNPFLSKLVFKNAFINCVPSRYLQKTFEKEGFNTIYIPNPIDIEKYVFTKKTYKFPRLLWVRAFDKIYNPLMAIEVLAALRVWYPNATLCMVGPEKDYTKNEVLQLIEYKNLTDSVEITGFLKKEDWMEKANNYNIFINTTHIDNIPVSVLEAMALGLPVVSTNVGGMPYLIKNEYNGLLVKDGDVESMAKTIDYLIKDPKLANKIALNARADVLEFKSEKVLKKWIKLLTT